MTALPGTMLVLSLVFGLPRQTQAREPAHRRVVPVSAIGRDGKAVPGLAAANFRAKAHGQEVTVLSASFDGTTARRIAVVVDASSSMTEKWASVWGGAEDAVAGLAPNNKVALFTATGRLQKQCDLSSDPKVLREAVLKARAEAAEGPSALYDEVNSLSRGQPGNTFDVIYLLTDGEDTASVTKPSDAAIAAARNAVRVFVLLFERRYHGNRGSLAFSSAESEMRGIAEATGGSLFKAAQFKGVEGLRALYPLLTGAYYLEAALPQGFNTPRDWNFEAIDADGKKLKGVQLVYPRRLVPQSE